MRKIILIPILLVSICAQQTQAANTRVTNPDAVGIEFLGRGLLGSVFYDRVMSEEMSAGFGYGAVATRYNGLDTGVSASLIPVYLNYYFMREQGSFLLTAGVTLVTNSNSIAGFDANPSQLTFTSSMLIPNLGLGYENRGDSGFLFRVGGYAFFASKVTPWLGFSFGYAF